jgi:UDP-GlcNAc:undecaprenyl-phosphate GlcNAc-1-phosphate transferase
LALLLTPLAGRLGHRLGIVDRPGGRRAHKGQVSRLGGVALFVAFSAAIGVAAWRGILTAGYNGDDFTRLNGLLIGGLGAFLFGLLDDRFELSPGVQLACQFVLSLVAVSTLIILERFTLPFFGYVELHAYSWGRWLSVLLTIFWMMGMMNTVNWLDGLDGLAGGVGAILCLVLAIHMHRVGQPSVALLPLALLGVLVGFLPHNFAARIFLGSAGAFFLGYALGGLGLIAGGRVATVLLVMGLPIVDVAWQIFDRLRHRHAPGQADRGHLHFRLLDLGLSPRTIVLLYWGFCALFGVLALVVSSRLYKLLALAGIGIVVVVVLVWLSRRGKT